MDLFSDVQWDMIKMIDGNYKPLNLSLTKMSFSYMLSYILDWNNISWINNYKYTTDGIHFSKHFGEVIEDIVKQWVETYLGDDGVIQNDSVLNF